MTTINVEGQTYDLAQDSTARLIEAKSVLLVKIDYLAKLSKQNSDWMAERKEDISEANNVNFGGGLSLFISLITAPFTLGLSMAANFLSAGLIAKTWHSAQKKTGALAKQTENQLDYEAQMKASLEALKLVTAELILRQVP